MMLRGLHVAIIQTAALLVPAPERAEWLAEWRAELWYVDRRATAFCLGSICDAFWMNRNTRAPRAHRWFSLESPVKCVMFLAALTALSFLLAFGPSGDNLAPPPRDAASQSVALAAAERDSSPPSPADLESSLPNRMAHSSTAGAPKTEPPPGGDQDLPFACFSVGLVSLAVLSSVRPLRLGEYPVNRYAPAAPFRLLRWVFLALKMALVVPIALCGAGALGPIVPPLAGWVLFLGLFFGFRWALMDQRERCPVCLRLLSNPTCIGDPSQSFLGWYGTELLCSRGHGFLYIPGTSTSWGGAQRWQYLDPAWDTLLP
jgi:hypothetical protein